MQRKKVSTNSDDEEEIIMDDKLSEEVEQIGRSNSGSTQVYQKNGFDKGASTPPNQQEDKQPKKQPQVISLALSESPTNKQQKDQNEDKNQTQKQPNQHESITLKEKLLNIFTNVGPASNPAPAKSGKPKSYALQLEDNLIENKGKKGDVHHFKIDNDLDMFEDEQQDGEQEKSDKSDEEQKKNGGILLFDQDEVNEHPEIEIGSHSRKTSEDYISLPENKQQNFELFGKQLTEYESQMQQAADKQKQQEYDLQAVRKLLSHYDNVKIVKMEQFESSNMKEVHSLNMTIQKGKVFNFDETQLFKGNKQPEKKKGLLDYLTNRVTRYVLIYNEYIAFCIRNKKNEFTVCSVNPLSNLFQLYNDKNSTQVRLYFVNKQRDQYSKPIQKLYNIENKEQFLISLRQGLNKIGLDYSLS